MEVDRIWRSLRLAPGALVLDIGCGSGRLLKELRRRGATVFGIEAAPQMAARARAELEGAVRESDVSSMDPSEFESAFDACLSMPDGVLGGGAEEDDLVILKRAVAYTRPGGRIVVAVPHVAHYMSERSFCPVRSRYSKSLPAEKDTEVSNRAMTTTTTSAPRELERSPSHLPNGGISGCHQRRNWVPHSTRTPGTRSPPVG
jgi:SAM-dependent methyltransferase